MNNDKLETTKNILNMLSGLNVNEAAGSLVTAIAAFSLQVGNGEKEQAVDVFDRITNAARETIKAASNHS